LGHAHRVRGRDRPGPRARRARRHARRGARRPRRLRGGAAARRGAPPPGRARGRPLVRVLPRHDAPRPPPLRALVPDARRPHHARPPARALAPLRRRVRGVSRAMTGGAPGWLLLGYLLGITAVITLAPFRFAWPPAVHLFYLVDPGDVVANVLLFV